MNTQKNILFIIHILLLSHNLLSFDVTITINTALERKTISPYIYGTNALLTEEENWTMRRSGGNRMSGYNWENNASNAGSDWNHSSDNYLGGGDVPGKVLSDFHTKSLELGTFSLVTLQMAGYVARDKNGTVSEAETAPSNRWNEAVPRKNAVFTTTPDVTDNYVYMDECVNFLVETFGSAGAATGIPAYCLDNEPALWISTHPRIHPDQVTCQEIIERSVALAQAVKDVDSAAAIFGPVLYGFAAYTDLQSALDWGQVSSGTDYAWFIDYYLDEMKRASDTDARRLLDVLDIHWYPEARGYPPGGSSDGYRIVMDGGADFETFRNSREVAQARMQAPRTLWQEGYIESSWIGQWGQDHLPLLPALHNSIATYFPDTKLAVTEFTYGGEDHISGGIAMADALGIFGKYGVHYGTYWNTESQTDYTTAAYQIYRNYDGVNSTYGSIHVQAETNDIPNSSAYASVFDEDSVQLHCIVINKNLDTAMQAAFSITSETEYRSCNVWAFNESSASIIKISSNLPVTNNALSYTIPELTICHFVFDRINTSIYTSGTFAGSINNCAVKLHGNVLEITYCLSKSDMVAVGLYTINGKCIKELPQGNQHMGHHILRIDCGGFSLSRGIYFVQLRTENDSIIRSLCLLNCGNY